MSADDGGDGESDRDAVPRAAAAQRVQLVTVNEGHPGESPFARHARSQPERSRHCVLVEHVTEACYDGR